MHAECAAFCRRIASARLLDTRPHTNFLVGLLMPCRASLPPVISSCGYLLPRSSPCRLIKDRIKDQRAKLTEDRKLTEAKKRSDIFRSVPHCHKRAFTRVPSRCLPSGAALFPKASEVEMAGSNNLNSPEQQEATVEVFSMPPGDSVTSSGSLLQPHEVTLPSTSLYLLSRQISETRLCLAYRVSFPATS